MIGRLTGKIDSVGDGFLILDVGGVGYYVQASARTLSAIGQSGDPASLLIHTQVREDAITLFGFASAAEQAWFKLLTSVQGVGAKVGLSILSVCAPEDLGFILASQDKTAITQADGVGPKLAVRILTELKDKAEKLEVYALPKAGKQVLTKPLTGGSIDQDAVSALTNLGYPNAEAYRAVMAAKAKANDNDLQGLIKLALKELSG
jgi:Holliday junction DNA helicase RuvA